MEINQSYKAPSIPKISRRNIKSSVFSGATTSQLILKKSSFSFVKSFIKPKVSRISPTDLQTPEAESKESSSIFGLGKVLEQTNKILVDVKKQLSLDFLNRIFNEKKSLESEKKKIAAKKVADKEAKIEQGGKGILGKTFEKVTAPFRSIFDKLIDFFSIILTGILVNNAFKWLSKKENQKKLAEFFDFIKEYWQELLIIFAAYKLARLVSKILGIAKGFRTLIDLFKKNPPRPPGGGPGNICNQFLNCFGNPAVVTSFAGFLSSQPRIYNTIKGIAGGTILPPIGIPGLPPVAPGAPTRPVGGSQPALPIVPVVPGGSNAPSGQQTNPTPTPTPTPAPTSQPGPSNWGAGMWASLLAAGYTVVEVVKIISALGLSLMGAEARAEGGTIKESPKKKCTACSIDTFSGFSNGGTVGKGDRPGIDMVPAMTRGGTAIRLDEGEEVTKRSESMRWRPLLKDVNDNGAKMWQAFTRAIKGQEEVNTIETGNTDTFSKLLEEYEKMLKDEERRLRQKYIKSIGGTTSPTQPPAPTPPSPTPAASPTPSSTSGTSPAAPAAAPAASPSTPAVMPNASQPGAPGIPGDPGSPKIGEPVGASSQNNETVVQSSTPESVKPLQTSTTVTPTLPTTQTSVPINPSSPETDASQKLTSLPFKVDTSFNYKNYFSNFSKLQPNNLQKVFEDKNSLLSPSSSSVSVINMPLPPITVDNSKPGSIPAPSGNPTPLPNISSINPLYEEEIALTAVTLGILV